jgi:flagellar biosynthesis protein FlhF
MNVMRFVGRTARDAMRKVRDALGPDALVLANRPCAEGVELLAAAPGTLAPLGEGAGAGAARVPSGTAGAAAGPGPGASPGSGAAAADAMPAGAVPMAGATAAAMSTVSFQDYVRQRLRDRHRTPVGAAPAGAAAPVAARPAARADAPAAGAAPGTPGEPAVLGRGVAGEPPAFPRRELPAFPRSGDGEPFAASERPSAAAFVPPRPSAGAGTDPLVAEMQALKATVARQFATISWFEGVRRSPVQGALLKTMVAAGFSLKLARSVVSRLPSDYGERDAQAWLEDVLARNVRCARPGETFEAGGVFALVGPTGVGKTTTTAKIAARQVLKHGAHSVALITVDTYRLGAHDQLRAFGRILGVPVHVAHDAPALHDLLRLRASRQLVLIDTVGMGHRDERIGGLLMSLPRSEIRHVVVASSAAQAETVDQSLRAYEARQAAGVVLTKIDEAARLGGALDCLLRQRLPLLGVCDGQRVPEDWHAPEPAKLMRRALLAPPAGAFALDDEELPLVFGVASTLQGDAAHA